MNRSYFYMLIAALCWGGAFVAGKIGSADVSGLEMSFYRFSIAAVCLLIYIRVKKLSFRIGLRNILKIAAIGSFGMITYHLLFFKSIALISVLESSSINVLAPVLSAFFGYLLFREPLNWKGVIFLLSSSFGVLTIIISWDFGNLLMIGQSSGTLYMVVAMLSWVVYSLLFRRFIRGVPAAISSFISMLSSLLILLPFILIKGAPITSYGISVWAVYLFMGIFATFLGYTLQQDSIMKIGVARTNFFINFVPVFSMILGVVILGDEFRMINILSLAIVFTGLVGYMREKEKSSVS
ncbi:MAG: DMT family transporter [Spirochaetales bacterium]|uniref:DMT family transporter n=1 Tax=Candidatus Thalassospirochaeta sargassi TaxID=3119039 RepID=A0AAJ1IEW8_9SPIO|nr:DMT family transporter [Spirochaetales bacterium]